MDNKLPILSIIDADFIPFYVCNNRKGEVLKTAEDCIVACDDFIANINKYNNSDYYIGYLTIGKCFRYTINPEYKAKRNYSNMPPFIQEVRQHLIDKHNFIGQENYEADDLVVSFKVQNSQFKSIIVSPDKDILNLEGKHLNPRLMSFKKTSKEEADSFFALSLIKGDTVDNIKGIPNKGEAYFNKKFKDIIPTIGDILDEYILCLGEIEGVKAFYTNYNCLKLIDTVQLETIKINKVEKTMCE